MGLPQLRPEETASHDLEILLHTFPVVRVAIDVAKLTHQVLLELPSGTRRVMRVANTKAEIDRFVATLRALELSCEIAFEPTGDYHRPLAYLLGQAAFISAWCRRLPSLAHAKPCTTPGTRTIRKTRRSFCIC